jgi:hypothetical protein
MDPDIAKQITSLVQAELNRINNLKKLDPENNRNDYPILDDYSAVDGDTIHNIHVYWINSRLSDEEMKEFPRSNWIVYIPDGRSILMLRSSTIMAFSKHDLALVYFGSANDEG